MKRLFYTSLIGVVLAGIVHLLIIFLIPSYATKDAWATLEQIGEPWKFTIVALPGQSESILPLVDPTFGVAACRFDLEKAPLSVESIGDLPFWSVAVFDRQGRNIYSFNDRTSIDRHLFLIVVNSVQMAQLRKNPPDEIEKAVLTLSDSNEGFVLIRALQPDGSWKEKLNQFLSKAKCEQFNILEERTTQPES
ncbi:MAG: DUF1254 domain-containing protein [Rhizobiaceae bacterium]